MIFPSGALHFHAHQGLGLRQPESKIHLVCNDSDEIQKLWFCSCLLFSPAMTVVALFPPEVEWISSQILKPITLLCFLSGPQSAPCAASRGFQEVTHTFMDSGSSNPGLRTRIKVLLSCESYNELLDRLFASQSLWSHLAWPPPEPVLCFSQLSAFF